MEFLHRLAEVLEYNLRPQASTTHCLQCGQRLNVVRRYVTRAYFCSPEHRTTHNDELAQLAVARLVGTPTAVGQ